MGKVAIILLAGGEASRYKASLKSLVNNYQDKLLSKRGNISLLEFVVGELRPLGDIFIVTKGEERKKRYSALLNEYVQNNDVKIISEHIKKSIGPLGGIYSVLKHCGNIQTTVILPADLPNVKEKVIAELIAKAFHSKSFDLVSLVHPNGQTEHLVLIIRFSELLRASQFLIDMDIHRVSSLIRLISKKRFINSAYLIKDTENNEVFYDLDIPSSIPKIRTSIKPVVNFPYVDFGLPIVTDEKPEDPSVLYQKFLDLKKNDKSKDQQGKHPSLIALLQKESNIYKERGLLSLSLHCLLDMYKINQDPIISDQIDELIMKLEPKGENQTSLG
ncbi:MAG: nucleotidyltransferase family protein [Candidatus Heimdallarchaeota archaeon]|nr:MAG: nucleotidyltransferase family protein [Candidatus Heimdallarchaeota archaeon]